MEFTGERYVPELHGNIELEHLHRYLQACEIAEGKIVLDIASGEGYGSSMLATKARFVTGVDISTVAIQHARERYKQDNLEFKVGSCLDIPLPNASIDLVVSFETIEHLDQHEKMMQEIKRVLLPDGALLISSPEKNNYSRGRSDVNPYHVKELYQHEFEQLLESYFKNIVYFGQRIEYGSNIFSVSLPTSVMSYLKENEQVISAPGVKNPVYLIALASDSHLPNIASSVLEQPINDSEIVQSWSEVVSQCDQTVQSLLSEIADKEQTLRGLTVQVAELDTHLKLLTAQLKDQDVQVQVLTAQLKDQDVQVQVLTAQLSNKEYELSEIKKSKVWMLALLFRRIRLFLAPTNSRRARFARLLANLLFLIGKKNVRKASDNRDLRLIIASGLFDRDWYLANNPDVAQAHTDPLLHYLRFGGLEGRNPNPDFQSAWYLETYKDVREAGLNPLVHYLKYGKEEGRYPSGESALIKSSALFDEAWYLSRYPDVAQAKVDPALHYLHCGGFEGRDPSPEFSSSWYLYVYKDVQIAKVNPLVHYLKYGREEGRVINSVVPPLATISMVKPIEDFESFAKKIHLSTALDPEVSIIIPIYGNCEYTLRCLSAIAAHASSIPFEIIVVNDCSPDNSVTILQHVNGIHLVNNAENQGFIRSCNLGAKVAKGQYLHFLNNDTEVTADWLDELIRTFYEFPETGLVGSKLTYPDGTLQEAGCIIWQDGSVWNFGRNQNALLPIYNYAREVDYCSGASIMIPRLLFEELGGFDEHYLPAYCEDADLALKIRERGLRVIYQPLSVVVHHEGATSGKDTSQGAKTYQIENLKKLFQRWEKFLEGHQAPGKDVDNAKDRVAERRVLVLDHLTPAPDLDSGSIDTFNILLLLREMGFQPTFIPEDNLLYVPKYTSALQRVGVEALFTPYCTSVEQHLKEFGERYDLVFLFRVGVVEKHLQNIRKYCSKAKVLFHTVDLHHIRMSREAELLSDEAKRQAADQMRATEFTAIRSVDMATVISTKELELLRSELPDEKLRVLPYSRHICGTDKSFKDRQDIVFVGSYQHPPNVDAIQYFITEIMPFIRHRLPGVRLNVVGSNLPAEIRSLACDDILMVGFVEDLPSFLDRMRVNIAPLRYGAGIKGKIGYAMAVGLPSVTTSLAAEGMLLTDGENILIADGPEVFADKVSRLYENETLWDHLSQVGLEHAERMWGAESAWSTLNSILSEIGLPGVRGDHPLSLYSSSRKDGIITPKGRQKNWQKSRSN